MSRNILLFVSVSVVWGLTWLPVKLAVASTPPVLLGATRITIAGLLMVAVSGPAGWRALAALSRRERWRLAVSGQLVNTLCYAALLWGVSNSSSGLAAIVNLSLIPIFSGLFGWLHGMETFDARKLGAVALGVAGLLLLFSGQTATDTAAHPVLGLAAVAWSSISYCWGAVLTRPLLDRAPTFALAGGQMLIGAATMLPLSFALERPGRAELLSLVQWPTAGALAFLVLGGSFIGFMFYLKLLREWGPFRAGFYAFVSPVIAVVVGVAALGEPFGLLEAAGAFVMFAATALAVGGRRVAASPLFRADPAKSAG